MAETTSNKPDNKAENFFLRPGKEATDLTTGDFTLNSVKARMVVNAEGDIEVYKINKNGVGTKPIATGKWRKASGKGENASRNPNIRGFITTGKGTTFRLVGWLHGDEGDQFYSFGFDQQQRNGSLFFA